MILFTLSILLLTLVGLILNYSYYRYFYNNLLNQAYHYNLTDNVWAIITFYPFFLSRKQIAKAEKWLEENS